jgi:hypothetical protein
MKYLLALVLIPIATLFASSNKPIDKEKCSCEGIPLYGNVKVVTCAPTFNVKVVDCAENMDIKVVDCCPTQCGEWRFVDCGEDFSIRFVDCGEDFSIRFVDCAPGVR